ncbi:DUF4229 domain-containing protein [Coraliomargarita akajimensis]|uniref:DUF4229 domain-containing protein n=1 Tax=Coraliomargarita akajimensis TaxID=395922 RepID=UPI0011D07F4D|nr:DUF4229 domain-containing protein [Coraliomargarita akajimensis]
MQSTYTSRRRFAVVAGVFVFITIAVVVSRMGGSLVGSLALALVIAGLLSWLAFRERRLFLQLEMLETAQRQETSKLSGRLDRFYQDPAIALVEFDPVNLLIKRAGDGFSGILGVSESASCMGKRLDEVLTVDLVRLELLVEQIRCNPDAPGRSLSCRDVDGRELKLYVSGYYLEDQQTIEAVLSPMPESYEAYAESQQTADDLERFRKGMVRREQRILELKAEVNALLADAHKEARYQIDSQTSDLKVRSMSVSRSDMR